jgi:two-component system, NtrC family, sensor kinase
MKLTWKLTVFLVLGTLVVTAAVAAVRIRQETGSFEADIRQDNDLLGRAVAAAARRMWETAGEAQALALVKEANERETQVEIRWVWLNAPSGDKSGPAVDRRRLAVLERGEVAVLRLPDPTKGQDVLYTFVPVRIPGDRRAAIELGESLAKERAFVRGMIGNVVVTTFLIVVVCGAIAMGLGVFFVGRPVRALVEQARRVGHGDLASRTALRPGDELGDLSREMNAMCDQLAAANGKIASETAARLATIEQLRHADRLMTVGKLASGIAHELGTPINVVAGRAQLIADDHEPGTPAHDNAAIVIEQAERMATIIRQLLDFARRQPAKKSRQPLHPVVAQTVDMLTPMARKRGIDLVVEEVDEGLVANLDPSQLQQVVINLVVNGIHAMRESGTVSLGIGREHVTPPPEHGGGAGDYLSVRVRDQGVGIPEEVVPHIFEPFFTTKDVGDGTGLGLSVAYGIVQEHSGWITVDSKVGKGSCFTVYLPQEGA